MLSVYSLSAIYLNRNQRKKNMLKNTNLMTADYWIEIMSKKDNLYVICKCLDGLIYSPILIQTYCEKKKKNRVSVIIKFYYDMLSC